MSVRSCDFCQNAAVIHDTILRGGVVKVRHLCRAHGLRVWRDALPTPGGPLNGKSKNPVLHSPSAQAGKMMQRRGDAQPPK